VLWPAETTGVAAPDAEAKPQPLFVLVRGELIAANRYRIRQVVFGDPQQTAK
jgi:hypothetical protein